MSISELIDAFKDGIAVVLGVNGDVHFALIGYKILVGSLESSNTSQERVF